MKSRLFGIYSLKQFASCSFRQLTELLNVLLEYNLTWYYGIIMTLIKSDEIKRIVYLLNCPFEDHIDRWAGDYVKLKYWSTRWLTYLGNWG